MIPDTRPLLGDSALRALRRSQVESMAARLGLDPDALERAAGAAWSNMNPQSTSWERALSVAGAALKAAGLHAPPF